MEYNKSFKYKYLDTISLFNVYGEFVIKGFYLGFNKGHYVVEKHNSNIVFETGVYCTLSSTRTVLFEKKINIIEIQLSKLNINY